ncbi:MAG TPA: GNAT family N-acetyltransferase [Acidimicrobiales bacterium]|nr:GNAT family N-acetyltransferase [Acidimicrobiales bacterium]
MLIPPERLGEVKAALAVFPRLRPQDEHVYLHAVATHPHHQGHGHGARLLAALRTRATEKSLFCLESTNARNHPFYLRNGFHAGVREALPGSGVIATALARREAAADSGGSRSV